MNFTYFLCLAGLCRLLAMRVHLTNSELGLFPYDNGLDIKIKINLEWVDGREPI